MDKITKSHKVIEVTIPEHIGIQESGVPKRPDPVLAVIEAQGSLGRSEWREVVAHNGDQWVSFEGSDTFEDGERVLKWIYVNEVI